MLDLLAFDLDGTLADTEGLKAESYGYAAHRLRPDLDAGAVAHAYGDCVGRSRREISEMLLSRFDLAEAARAHDATVEPWESYVGIRLEKYRAMLADGDLLQRHALAAARLVPEAHRLARRVALVTTSGRRNATLVLRGLGLADAFDLVVTADEVAHTKPDPEGYRLALARAAADPARSLIVEDSAAGAGAALAAGVPVVVVPNALTHEEVGALVASGGLAAEAVVEPDALAGVLRERAAAATAGRSGPGPRR